MCIVDVLMLIQQEDDQWEKIDQIFLDLQTVALDGQSQLQENNLKQNATATANVNLNLDQECCTILAPNAGIKAVLDPTPVLPAITAKAPSSCKRHDHAMQTVGTDEKEESTKAVVKATVSKACTLTVRNE